MRSWVTAWTVLASGMELEAVILEPPYSDVTATYADLASANDLVFGSAVMGGAIALASDGDEDTTFVLIDSVDAPELPNTVGVDVRSHEDGSYLVGAAAALESRTGKVGYIGANISPVIEEFRSGFERGAKAVAARHRGHRLRHRSGRPGWGLRQRRAGRRDRRVDATARKGST